MKQRFQSRAAFLEERIEMFLTTVTELGGYCTLEQAKRLALANSEASAGKFDSLMRSKSGRL